MRLAIVNLTSGGLSGGYRKYLSRLMPLLANDARVTSLLVFVPEGAQVELESGIDVRTWPRVRTGRSTLVRAVADFAPDVVFVPTARYADFGAIPVVTMVRNMEPLTVPFDGNTWSEGLKNIARAWEARRASRRATRVIAVSEHVREFIRSRWHIEGDRIGLVYHGVDDPDPVLTIARSGSVTLFTAGSIRPARGLEDIIRAMPLLDSDTRLVIAGRVDAGCAGYNGHLSRLCRDLGVASRVVFAGHLASADMASAFRSCHVFVMTSRAEACPNTALEAMSCGCAIVSVDRAPMPEFFGEAALYYPVADSRTLAARLRGIIASTAEHGRLACASRRRAARFTWDATRDGTIEELARAR